VRLFLFDIDGTLVSVRGAGRTAFARALEETYGTAGTIERYDFRGRTDLSIVHELMTARAWTSSGSRARRRMLPGLRARAHADHRDGSRSRSCPASRRWSGGSARGPTRSSGS